MTETERVVVRECDSYEQAQRAVDFLSDREIEVSGIQIVGTDLRMVETVTGRMSYGRAAGAGMVTGAWFGLLIGMLLGFFANPDQDPNWTTLLLLGVLWGALFGIVYGLLAHAATRGRRDFSSRSKFEAAHYQVTCPLPIAGQVRQALAEMPTGR